MDLKAFNKIYSEAVEAISERRISDALELTEAIVQDTMGDESVRDRVAGLRADYDNLLHTFAEKGKDTTLDGSLSSLFRQVIELLQRVRTIWAQEHKSTLYGRIASKLSDLTVEDMNDQLRRTISSSVGKPDYHEALDTVFGMAWLLQPSPEESAVIVSQLRKTSSFTRRAIVGGFLVGCLDCFSPTKIRLLLSLGATAGEDLEKASFEEDDKRPQMEDDAHDLLARVAVALTVVYLNDKSFFVYYPELVQEIRTFFLSEHMKPELPSLFHAVVCQSLTDRVGKRVDDILTIIKDTIEKQQPHLGSNEKEETKDGAADGFIPKADNLKKDFDIKITRIEIKAGKKLFQEMANYAQSVDAMRKGDMDVNFSNFIHMKQFDFFGHPAHWFYPFTMDEPTAQKGLYHPDGKPDNFTLSIMNHNRFCDNDRYSYAGMMAFLRRGGRQAISDYVRQQFEENQDDDQEGLEELFDIGESEEYRLNNFTNYCQVCYRFLHSHNSGGDYRDVFASSDDIILPMAPLFEGLFNDTDQLDDSIESYLHMGDSEHAIIFLNFLMEHHGATARMLGQRGRAFMQLRQWHSAVSSFQQSLLMEEDDATQFRMARCYEALKEWDLALPLLQHEDQRLESRDADLIEEIARCLVQLGRWDDAVQRFFQLEFMGTHLNVSRRGIGWCSLHQGKYERAEQYYRTLLDVSKKKLWEDRLNLGHALWLQGRTADALAAYKQFAVAFNRSKKAERQNYRHWSEAFREDARNLLAAHLGQEELALMQDAIAQK